MAGYEKQTLMENQLGEVRTCACGGIHLTIGAMTLHFRADDVDALLELACAAQTMATFQEAAPETPPQRRQRLKLKAHRTFH